MKDERELVTTFDLSPGQIAWRRHTIQNECMNDMNKFNQEYPNTPEEAFLSTGHNAFPLLSIEQCYKPMNGARGFLYMRLGRYEFKRDPTSALRIYQYPAEDKRWGQYIVSGDPTRTAFGDGTCIQVLNMKTFEQVAVFHGYMDPIPFADEMMKLGRFYNDAVLNVEINGPGYATIGAIMQVGISECLATPMDGQGTGQDLNIVRLADVLPPQARCNSTRHQSARPKGFDHSRPNHIRRDEELRLSPGGELGPASPQGNDDSVTSLLIAVASVIYNDPQTYGEGPAPVYDDLFDQPPWEAFR